MCTEQILNSLFKLVENLDKVDQIYIEGLFDFKMMFMIVRK